jgi:hypothetical protein
MRPSLRKRRLETRSPIAGEKDLARVAPYRATWTCDCGSTNTIYFNYIVTIGHVYGKRMTCPDCLKSYRGLFINGLSGRL